MQRPSKKAPLKDQQDYWYQILKNEGFEDIEDPVTRLLKHWSGQVVWKGQPWSSAEGKYTKVHQEQSKQKPVSYGYSNITWKKSQAEYYRQAAQFLHSHTFISPTEHQAWKLHSEGISLRKSAAQLQISVQRMRYLIEQLRGEMLNNKRSRNRYLTKKLKEELAQPHKVEAITLGSTHAPTATPKRKVRNRPRRKDK